MGKTLSLFIIMQYLIILRKKVKGATSPSSNMQRNWEARDNIRERQPPIWLTGKLHIEQFIDQLLHI
jgi:hypothetical protein